MGLRFHRSKRLIPGVRLNMSGSGPSVSLGVKGARLNIGPKGSRTTVGVPSSGLSYVSQKSWGSSAPVNGAAYGQLTPAQLKAMAAATWFDVSGRVARGEVPEAREREILALIIAATPLAKVRADLRILDAFYAAARGAFTDEEYQQTRSLYLDSVAGRKPSDPVAPWPQAQLAAALGEVSDEERAVKLAEVQKLHDDASGLTARRAESRRLLWLLGGIFAASVVVFTLLINWLGTSDSAASGSASTDPANVVDVEGHPDPHDGGAYIVRLPKTGEVSDDEHPTLLTEGDAWQCPTGASGVTCQKVFYAQHTQELLDEFRAYRALEGPLAAALASGRAMNGRLVQQQAKSIPIQPLNFPNSDAINRIFHEAEIDPAVAKQARLTSMKLADCQGALVTIRDMLKDAGEASTSWIPNNSGLSAADAAEHSINSNIRLYSDYARKCEASFGLSHLDSPLRHPIHVARAEMDMMGISPPSN